MNHRGLWTATLLALLCLALAAPSSFGQGGKKKPATPKPAAKPAAPRRKPPAKSPGFKPKPPAEKPDEKKPKTPVYVPRDVPEPPVPTITDVPAGLEPEAWHSWAKEQDVTPLHRIMLSASFQLGGDSGNRAGNGSEAPYYDDILFDGPALGPVLEIGYAPLPVAVLIASFTAVILSGDDYPDDYGHSGMTSYYFDGTEILYPCLSLRFRFPLALWTLRKTHFRFTRCDEITGVLLFFQLGAGPAIWGAMEVGIDSGSGENWIQYWDSTVNFTLSYSGGLEFRWPWGSVGLAYIFTNFGQPASAWPPNSDADNLVMHMGRLIFSIYF